MFEDQMTLNWKPPEDDGGCPIEGYEIEKMDMATGRCTQFSVLYRALWKKLCAVGIHMLFSIVISYMLQLAKCLLVFRGSVWESRRY